MNREKIIDAVEKALRKAEDTSNPILVDFVTDEIYWREIAKVAVDAYEELI